ncbi:MAG: hypothetical protein KC503_14340, partial [Myxococcales bacterium]|nr:hypothetical protein [Myxococcales bacterium]
RAIARLLSDESRARRLATSAYERVRSRLTAASARRKLLAAYLGLVPDAEARPPSPAVPRAALEGSGSMTQTHRTQKTHEIADTDVSARP